MRADAPNLEIVPLEDLGSDELFTQGLQGWEVMLELAVRACRKLGIERATVPESFPVGHADHLRANGIELVVERDLFDNRRRSKNETELRGIRNAQKACEAALDASRELLRRAQPNGAGLEVDGRAADLRASEARDRGRLRGSRGRGQRDDRRARAADGGRARHGLGPDRGERADRVRSLPQGQGHRLLRRHDAHVRRRRAVGRGQGVVPARQGRARDLDCRRQARRERPQALRGGLRHLPRGRLQDAAPQGAGRSAGGRLLPRPGSRCRARGARAAVAGPHRARPDSRRRRHGRAGAVPVRATAACASRISSS